MHIRALLPSILSTSILFACGGGKSTPPPATPATAVPSGTSEASTPPALVAFEMSVKATLDSTTVLPGALTSLEWPATPITRSVAAQQRRYAAAGPDARQREAADLATALWYAEPTGSDAERAAREEARKVLREVVAAKGASETVLWMLTVAERAMGDVAASGQVYDELILRFPRSPRAWRYRAVRAWIDLRGGDHARAAEIIDGADLAAASTPSAVHYVAGWIALRRGQATEAHALLVTAMQRWADLWSWDTVRQEGFAVAAIAGASPAYMLQVAAEIANGPPRREAGTTNKRIRTVVRDGKRITVTEETSIRYEQEYLGLELGRAYATWGRFEEAKAVLERSRGGSPSTDAAIERELMLLAASANQPAAVAAHAGAAKAAVQQAKSDVGAGELEQLEAALARDVERLAAEYAAFAGVTGLAAFGDAAQALAASNGAETAAPAATAQAATADEYRARVLDAQLAWTTPRLRACHAIVAQQGEPADGVVSFQLVPGADGRAEVSGLAPEAAEAGVGAVARCVAVVAASWHMMPAEGASETRATIELELRTR